MMGFESPRKIAVSDRAQGERKLRRLRGLVMKIFAGLNGSTATLPVALFALLGSLLMPTDSDAQFRYGRYGGGFGLSIGIGAPVGGFGIGPGSFSYGGFNYGRRGYGYGGFGYGGYGYGGRGFGGYGYGPGVALPVLPVPAYRVPIYRVPVQTFSLQIEPRRSYAAPHRDYVYPDPDYVQPESLYDYSSAKPPILQQSAPDGFGGPGLIQDHLVASATTLQRSLANRPDDADVWLDYLRPDLIIQSADDPSGSHLLVELLKNYDGVSGNAQLSYIWTEPGFRRTHQALRNYAESAIGFGTNQASGLQPDQIQKPSIAPQINPKQIKPNQINPNTEPGDGSDAIPGNDAEIGTDKDTSEKEELDDIQELPTPI